MKRFLKLFMLLPFICHYLTGCSDRENFQEEVNRRKVSVKIYEVSRGQLTSYLNLTGTTLPLAEARVGSKVEGTIQEILVDEGDRIKKGQVLIRLEPKDFLLGIDRTRPVPNWKKPDMTWSKKGKTGGGYLPCMKKEQYPNTDMIQ